MKLFLKIDLLLFYHENLDFKLFLKTIRPLTLDLNCTCGNLPSSCNRILYSLQ